MPTVATRHAATLATALAQVAQAGIEPSDLAHAIIAHRESLPALHTQWDYYRNPITPAPASRSGKPYVLAQQQGLPLRLSNPRAAGVTTDDRLTQSREIVIENDIAWRVAAMVDFLFGKPIRLVSAARTPALARSIESALEAVFEQAGGLAMLQEAALLGHVYGSVDFLVSPCDPDGPPEGDPAQAVRLTPLPPTRAVPITNPNDWRNPLGYAVIVPRTPDGATRRTSIEVHSPTHRMELLLHEPPRAGTAHARVVSLSRTRVAPGVLPVVHVQNVAQPLVWAGQSEVEPLIPLQDELNTRLSDRANRVTMQSFKMYLAKGIDGFERTPVGPGMLLSTDNPDASITTFGGDAASPSEDRHIDELREALDKISGVPPLATGVVRAKVGNLSSENALRLTLQGLMARTARKRVTYGRGITRACWLILSALHHAGVLLTSPDDRGVRIEWPDPLSIDQAELLRSAKAKRELGVATDRVLNELGYATRDSGVE